MARIKAKICLFTVLLLSQLAPLAGSATFGSDLPLNVDELSYLQEPKIGVARASKFEYANLDCRFLERMQVEARVDQLAEKRKARNNAIAISNANLECSAKEENCPAELTESAATRLERLTSSAKPSVSTNGETNRARWANSVVVLADVALEHHGRASDSIEWCKNQLDSFFHWTNENSSQAISTRTPGSKTESHLNSRSRSKKALKLQPNASKKVVYTFEPIKGRDLVIPMLLIPAKTSAHKLEPIQQIQIPVWWIKAQANENDIEKAFEPESHGIENETGRDPYWQYYEDCDRWGVEFARLLHEADHNNFKAAKKPARERFQIVVVSFEEKVSSDNDLWPALELRSIQNGSKKNVPLTIRFLSVIVDQNFTWLHVAPKMVDFYSRPATNAITQYALNREFIEVESRLINKEMICVKPLSPTVQAIAIHELVSGRSIGVLANDKLFELRELFDPSILSCYIGEAQSEYADWIESMLKRSRKAKLIHRLRLQSKVADRIEKFGFTCFQIADSIRWYQTDEAALAEIR